MTMRQGCYLATIKHQFYMGSLAWEFNLRAKIGSPALYQCVRPCTCSKHCFWDKWHNGKIQMSFYYVSYIVYTYVEIDTRQRLKDSLGWR